MKIKINKISKIYQLYYIKIILIIHIDYMHTQMQFRSYKTHMSDTYDIQQFTGLQSPRVYKCRFHSDEPIHLKISTNTYIEQTVYTSNF